MSPAEQIAKLEERIKSLKKVEQIRKHAAAPDNAIGRTLQANREAHQLGVDALAKKSGVSRSVIFGLEHGRRADMNLSTLRALAKAFDITASYLLAQVEDNDGEGK